MFWWPHGGHGDCARARAGYGARRWARGRPGRASAERFAASQPRMGLEGFEATGERRKHIEKPLTRRVLRHAIGWDVGLSSFVTTMKCHLACELGLSHPCELAVPSWNNARADPRPPPLLKFASGQQSADSRRSTLTPDALTHTGHPRTHDKATSPEWPYGAVLCSVDKFCFVSPAVPNGAGDHRAARTPPWRGAVR